MALSIEDLLAKGEDTQRQIDASLTRLSAGVDGVLTEVARLRDTLKWVRQTIHQAHHDGEIETCAKNTCRAITDALKEG